MGTKSLFAKTLGLAAGITFGVGLKLPVSSYAMQIDYAYQDFGFLGDIHRFSFDLKF